MCAVGLSEECVCVRVCVKCERRVCSLPWLLYRKAVDPQHGPQRIAGTVDHVLLLLVIQLFLHDVLAQVEQHLQGHRPVRTGRNLLELKHGGWSEDQNSMVKRDRAGPRKPKCPG